MDVSMSHPSGWAHEHPDVKAFSPSHEDAEPEEHECRRWASRAEQSRRRRCSRAVDCGFGGCACGRGADGVCGPERAPLVCCLLQNRQYHFRWWPGGPAHVVQRCCGSRLCQSGGHLLPERPHASRRPDWQHLGHPSQPDADRPVQRLLHRAVCRRMQVFVDVCVTVLLRVVGRPSLPRAPFQLQCLSWGGDCAERRRLCHRRHRSLLGRVVRPGHFDHFWNSAMVGRIPVLQTIPRGFARAQLCRRGSHHLECLHPRHQCIHLLPVPGHVHLHRDRLLWLFRGA
mmetsp:Transcript_15908/g.45547  ORF Transcript_15908/g.45547 Transcript_15908/m.45547 type:complete len:285 (+) Transcript_15908:1323-2177(+)